MHRNDATIYRHPHDAAPLRLEAQTAGDMIDNGRLMDDRGDIFEIRDGIPDLVHPSPLPEQEAQALATYQDVADVYDQYIHLTFDTFATQETFERRRMVERLNLRPGHQVLEFGCGSGRTTALMAERVGPSGRIWLQELSLAMLGKAAEKARSVVTPTTLSRANGCYLPFADNTFDAVFHFGGVNMFSDIRRCFSEAARVTKPGGRVVIGDENMPVWLRQTEMGRVLINSNRHYACHVPFDHIPVSARDVVCEWIIGGVFYLLSFSVGEGAPQADLDSRFLEHGEERTEHAMPVNWRGVTAEAKAMALAAAAREGKSVHEWLDAAVRTAAREPSP